MLSPATSGCLLAAVTVSSCIHGSGPSGPDRDREAAYRANNRGVALLEQQTPQPAVQAFRDALAGSPGLRLAAINLPIALYYAGRDGEAARAAADVQTRYPDAPQPAYIRGLVAQSDNRLDEALQAFGEVLALDPDDVGVRVHMARVHIQLQNYAAAVELCEGALAREPYNATAAYNLALALTRTGDREGGARAAQRFQELTAAAYGVTYSRAYLEQGRYAEALVSTGLEPDLLDSSPPGVTFVATTAGLPPAEPGLDAGSGPLAGGVTLADIDADGDLDIIVSAAQVRVLQNDRMRFTDVADRLGLPGDAGALGAVVADTDNDRQPDLLLLTRTGPRLFVRRDGRLEPVASETLAAAPRAPARTAALTDVDHDGDLDIVLGGFAPPGSPGDWPAAGAAPAALTRLIRNNGNGSFEDVTTAAGLAGLSGVVALAPTDFDNRRDIDLLMVRHGAAPLMLRNLRTGAFADVAADAGLPEAGDYTAVALGDVNKDGRPDLFLGRLAGPGLLAVSTGLGRFQVRETAAATSGALAAQLFDYDNDGLLDLLVAGPAGPRLFSNVGGAWSDRTATAFPSPLDAIDVVALATGDLDGDGDTDIAALSAGGALHVLRNEGGTRHRALRISLRGLVSNRGGVGSKIEVRAGSLYQRVETAAAAPAPGPADLLFGLGGRAGADVVRILWPAGILQAEMTDARDARAGVTIEELDRKPSSCPYLFVWDGSRFVFVTDFLGGGEMGYLVAPGVRNVPDPVEYVRITDGQLRERDGRFEIRVTNELEEVLFLDQLRLLAVTHDADTAIFPDEGLRAEARPFRIFAVRDIQPLAVARDDHGHDVLAALSARDRRSPDDFALLPVRGYARDHALVFGLPGMEPAGSGRVVLLLTGWTDYAFSRDNVAAHQAGHALVPPALQQQSADGTWRTIDADVGIPVGRPQTLVVDVTDAARIGRPLRLTTTMRIYWDQIQVGIATTHGDERVQELPPAGASLRWRGYSAEVSPDGGEPFGYDHARVQPLSPWKLMPGRYTREGDVAALVAGSDDRHVIARSGDEVAMAFDASALPPIAGGLRRTYLLHATGYSKEMDLHSASPDEAAPIPFRAMSGYPYAWPEAYPHVDDLERVHTRVVTRPLPSLHTLAP